MLASSSMVYVLAVDCRDIHTTQNTHHGCCHTETSNHSGPAAAGACRSQPVGAARTHSSCHPGGCSRCLYLSHCGCPVLRQLSSLGHPLRRLTAQLDPLLGCPDHIIIVVTVSPGSSSDQTHIQASLSRPLWGRLPSCLLHC